MSNILDVLPHFRSLAEFREFLNEQEPQINDGEQISKGKDPNETSKEEKEEAEPEPKEDPNDPVPVPAEGEAPPAPTIDPSQAPGSQVAIGKKTIKKSAKPDAKKLSVSGKKTKINMKPTIVLDQSSGKTSPYGAQ